MIVLAFDTDRAPDFVLEHIFQVFDLCGFKAKFFTNAI